MKHKTVGLCAFILGCAMASWASAAPILDLSIQCQDHTDVWASVIHDQGDGTLLFTGSHTCTDGKYVAEWDITVDPDPYVIAHYSITNSSLVTQTYTIPAILSVSPAITPSSFMGGSVAGSLTPDITAATLTSVSGSSIYTAYIDGNPVGYLLADPYSVTASSPFSTVNVLPDAFGSPIPSANGPAVNTNIGITLKFTLTPGDTASFTSIFVVEPVPEPAALGLLSLAGLAALRRRRA